MASAFWASATLEWGGWPFRLVNWRSTQCLGGIHPARTLPIILDMGTNNADLLKDPLYIGWRNQRVNGAAYEEFVDKFIRAIKRRYPNVLLQWEDFAKPHAWNLLEKYRRQICSFNDDIQGTAAVVLAAVASAATVKDQRFAVLGGGSAGLGICNQIVRAISLETGLAEEAVRKQFYVVDIDGLIHTGLTKIEPNQRPFAHEQHELKTWKVKNPQKISLLEVIENVHPTVLIGVSTQPGAFTEEIVRAMARHVKRPVIFPLSNPTSRCEARPVDLIKWTHGEAIIATGSPFDPVAYEGKLINIAQCNNVYIFPGVGLGLIATQAAHASDAVFITAAKVLASHSPMLKDPYGPLFPTLDTLRSVTRAIGIAVAQTVIAEGHARRLPKTTVEALIDETIWFPTYT